MVNFELFYCLVSILIDIIKQNEFLHFVIQILYSKSLPDSTNSRKMSSRLQHYLISGSFWDVVQAYASNLEIFGLSSFSFCHRASTVSNSNSLSSVSCVLRLITVSTEQSSLPSPPLSNIRIHPTAALFLLSQLSPLKSSK